MSSSSEEFMKELRFAREEEEEEEQILHPLATGEFVS